MFRRGLIIPMMLAAVPVAAAAWIFSPAILENMTGSRPPVQSAGLQGVALPDLDALTPRAGGTQSLGFDVARVERNGWSVFAGTAPAHSTVTVTADGAPIGTAKADERGEWTLLSDHRFAKTNPVLGLSARFEQPPAVESGSAETRAAAGHADPAKRMMRDFENMVAAAREPEKPSRTQAAVRAPVPIPIQFEYRQAVFTEKGNKAAELLSEYLKLKKPESVVLTGHADERGTDAFNMELSRQRLETVAYYLKENGFEGKLVLIPKGRSEPYRGVDRTTLDRDTLWQLDRRVELVLGAEAKGVAKRD